MASISIALLIMIILIIHTAFLLIMIQNVESSPIKKGIQSGIHQITYPDLKGYLAKDSDEFSPIDGTPPCAQPGSTFCEDVDDYPSAYVEKILKNSSFHFFFGNDATPEELAERNKHKDDHFICESEKKIIFPKVGKTKEEVWQYIINQKNSPEEYVQSVEVEICKNLSGPCRFYRNAKMAYILSCKQKYIYRRLLSINKSGTTSYDLFEMPSTCCCSYIQNNNAFFRSKGDK